MDDPSIRPRTLKHSHRDGVFRKAGRELHFVDGRPMKHKLAIRADGIACAVAMLKETGTRGAVSAR
jgi:hypothetical protein